MLVSARLAASLNWTYIKNYKSQLKTFIIIHSDSHHDWLPFLLSAVRAFVRRSRFCFASLVCPFRMRGLKNSNLRFDLRIHQTVRINNKRNIRYLMLARMQWFIVNGKRREVFNAKRLALRVDVQSGFEWFWVLFSWKGQTSVSRRGTVRVLLDSLRHETNEQVFASSEPSCTHQSYTHILS